MRCDSFSVWRTFYGTNSHAQASDVYEHYSNRFMAKPLSTLYELFDYDIYRNRVPSAFEIMLVGFFGTPKS